MEKESKESFELRFGSPESSFMITVISLAIIGASVIIAAMVLLKPFASTTKADATTSEEAYFILYPTQEKSNAIQINLHVTYENEADMRNFLVDTIQEAIDKRYVIKETETIVDDSDVKRILVKLEPKEDEK